MLMGKPSHLLANHMLRTLLLAVVSTGLLATSLFAQEDVRSDKRLPPGVLLYVSTPDIPATYEAFKNTSYGQLINSPELEEFRVELLEKFEEEAGDDIKKIEDELGMPLSDLAAFIAGDATLAIVRPIGQPPGIVAMMEYGDHDDILEKFVGQAEEQLTQQFGLEKSAAEYAGVELNVINIETEHPDFPTIDVTYFRKDQQAVLTSSQSLAEQILDRWDGQNEQCFANDEYYAEIVKQCSTDGDATPDMVSYADPIGITTAAISLVPQAKPFVNLIPLYLPTLGLNRFKATGSVMEVDTGDFNVVTKSLIYVERPASGILKMFELRPTLSGIPKWIPAKATQYFGFDWNVKGAYEAVESVYDGFLGPGAFDRQVTELTRQANQDNLHIKNDIIDVIAGKMEGYLVQAFNPEKFEMQFAAAIAVTDEEKAWKIVDAAIESAGDVEELELRGNRAYNVVTDETDVSLTVSNNHIWIASGMETLGQAVSGTTEGAALVDSKQYQRAKAHLPEEVSMLSFQSPAAQFRDLYEKLRKGELDAAVEGEFDFSVLPPFKDIEKYFTPSVGYAIPVEKGGVSVQYSLKAE